MAVGGLAIKPYRGWKRSGVLGALYGELCAVYALFASPANAVVSCLEALAFGLRFADVSPRELRYDELQGLGSGLREGLRSAAHGSYYGVYRFGQVMTPFGQRHVLPRLLVDDGLGWSRAPWLVVDISLLLVGVFTHPIGGCLDLVGKSFAGLLILLRARSERRRGRRYKTAVRHQALLQEYETMMADHHV